jgi:uncharacterized protein (TIGR04255 family)
MSSLPDYARPPIVEVAIGAQFAGLDELRAAHVGLFWATIRDDYGRIEEQPPVVHIVEGPSDQQLAGGPELRISTTPDLPRTWFLDSTGNRIIQVQRDRFLHNWRKMTDSDEYPRFPGVKKSFMKHWDGFCRFLENNGLPVPQVDQYELTYVNHIRRGNGWQSVEDLCHLFTSVAWGPRSAFLPPPENILWSAKFRLPEGNGRLHVDVVPVRIPPHGDLAVSLSLTARGMPPEGTDAGAMSGWFDIAREWIVRGFADLVAEKTDALWGRKA